MISCGNIKPKACNELWYLGVDAASAVAASAVAIVANAVAVAVAFAVAATVWRSVWTQRRLSKRLWQVASGEWWAAAAAAVAKSRVAASVKLKFKAFT